MLIDIYKNDKVYTCDLSKGTDISIPYISGEGPTAFGVDPYSAKPVVAGDFIGSLDKGSPVNFYNIFINPHGNGTHTESVKHIDKRGSGIGQTLQQAHFIAVLLTATAKEKNNGDLILDISSVDLSVLKNDKPEALIIRTRIDNNFRRDYTGTNPCYIDKELIADITDKGIQHLLIDLPSVDREEDEGKLEAHKAFWKTEGDIQLKKTITEMVNIDNALEDGLYLLNLQTISLDIDASPSRPILYPLLEK